MAVQLAADGRGYVAEIKLPRQVINPGFRPQPGDRLSFTWEINLTNANSTEPARAFQIFLNGGTPSSFRGPRDWGQAIFQ